uniref:Uncharacterized protein n=1 Tax=Anopheles dirus TaxID=7168 RepID=A0A182MZS3_9DIPT
MVFAGRTKNQRQEGQRNGFHCSAGYLAYCNSVQLSSPLSVLHHILRREPRGRLLLPSRTGPEA